MYLFENGKPKNITDEDKVLFRSLLEAPVRRLLEERKDGLFLVQDFYPCGAKRTDPFLVNDKEDTFYSELTSSLLHYEELTIIGHLIAWHKNGKKLLECCFQDFLLEGSYEEWNNEGIKQKEVNYKKGKLQGSYKRWHGNGHLEIEQYWENGQLQGKSLRYYQNGHLFSEINYHQGNREGISKDWYKNGQLKSEELYSNNKRNGASKAWYDTGVLKDQIVYKDGLKDGYSLVYYPNGQLKKKHYFKNNLETEIYELYNSQGKLLKNNNKDMVMHSAFTPVLFEFSELVEHNSRRVLEVKNDQLYLVQDFYDNGEKLTDPYYLLSSEEAYKTQINPREFWPKGVTGRFTQYDRLGNLSCEGYFIEGYRQGKWLIFVNNVEGTCCLKETHFFNKNILQRKIVWHSNGYKQKESIYKNNIEEVIGDYNEDGSFSSTFLAKILSDNNGNCICRKIIEKKGKYYIVQDFYYSGEKATNPYAAKKLKEIQKIMFHFQFCSIVGEIILWYARPHVPFPFFSLHLISAHKEGKTYGRIIKEFHKQEMLARYYCNKKGKANGLYQSWYSNRQIECEGKMRQGKKVGKWHYWNKESEKTMERYYLFGMVIKTKKLNNK